MTDWVDTLTELRGLVGGDINAVMVGGHNVIGDGGGGVFYWDASSSSGDNNGTIIVPTGASGRWVREPSDGMNVKWFGATGDGSTDDTAAINSTIVACAAAGGGDVLLPIGTYIVSRSDSTSGGCVIMKASTRLVGESREGSVIKLKSEAQDDVRPIMVRQIADVSVQNLTIDGNKGQQYPEEHRAGIFVWSSKRVYLGDLTIHDCTGDAIDIYGTGADGGSEDVTVERCYCYDNDRKAITINGGYSRRLGFRDCTWQNNVCQFAIETQAPVYDIVIERTLLDKARNNADVALSFGGAGNGNRASGLTARDCVINGPINVVYAENVRIENCRVFTDNTVGFRPLEIKLDCVDIVVDGCDIEMPACTGNGEGTVSIVASASAGSPQPRNVRITNNRIRSGCTTNHVINCGNVGSVHISGNVVESTITSHSRAAVAIVSTNTSDPVGQVVVANNRMIGFTKGVVVGGLPNTSVKSVVISGNVVDKGSNTSPQFAFDLNSSADVLQQCAVFDNETSGYGSVFRYPPCPMLVSGTRGGGGSYICAGTPTFTEIAGARAYDRTNALFYVRTSSGWVQA